MPIINRVNAVVVSNLRVKVFSFLVLSSDRFMVNLTTIRVRIGMLRLFVNDFFLVQRLMADDFLMMDVRFMVDNRLVLDDFLLIDSRLEVGDFLLMDSRLVVGDFLLMNNRLLVRNRLLVIRTMMVIMTFVVEGLMEIGLIVDRFMIDSLMMRDLMMGSTYIVIEDGQVSANGLMMLSLVK